MITAGGRAAVMLVLAQFSPAAYATSPSVPMQCFVEAGQRHSIDPLLLYAIAHVESGLNPSAINRNRDGSVDYGLMQINSQHLPRLKSLGVNAHRLLQEPCLSVHTGASILADMILRHGYTWTAVGAYNAGGRDNRGQARQKYAAKVWRRYASLSVGPSGKLATSPTAQLIKQPRAGQRSRPSNTIKQPRKAITGVRWTADDDQVTHLRVPTSYSFSIKQGSR